jgi:transposase
MILLFFATLGLEFYFAVTSVIVLALLLRGRDIVARLIERWGKGNHLDAVLVGGGGAALHQITNVIQERFPQARIVNDPQMAVARGYARLARYRLRQHAPAATPQEA